MRTLRLQRARGGAGANLPGPANTPARWCVTTAATDPDLSFIGTDPYNTNTFAGIQVPAVPSGQISNARYLFMLARAQFNSGQDGVQLVGIRQYADLIARMPGIEGAADTIFHREIVDPLFHPPDGNISWHVMVIDKTWRDRRNDLNTDSLIYQDSYSPALLYDSLEPYVPPNGGRPWGTPLDSSLGNMHELRYPYRWTDVERQLRIWIPVPSDIALFASVRQNDPTTNPTDQSLSVNQFNALEDEEQFLTAFHTVAQYGRIAGSLVFRGDSL